MGLVGFGTALLAFNLHAAAEAPSGLVGNWDVEHVAVDEQDQMHWGTRPDDPQLLGRELLIQPEMIHFTADEAPCKQPTWKPQTLTWVKLFAKSFSRASGGGRSTQPLPADFGLKVELAAKATFYQICPVPEVRPSDAWQYRRWIAQREPNLLVMHYTNQVLLTLRRRPPGEKPRASFDCHKAVTSTETTICGSYQLAGWDRSVAAAFRAAVERSPTKKDELREDQRRWLKNRDACGAKTECIDEMLWRRVEELGQR